MKPKVIITNALLITISLTAGACGLVHNSIEAGIEETNFRTECANRKSAYLNAQRKPAGSITDKDGLVEFFACTNQHTKHLTVAVEFEGKLNREIFFYPTPPPYKSLIQYLGGTMSAGTYTIKFLTEGKVWQKGSLEVKSKSHIRFVVDINEQTVQVDNSTVWKPNLAIAPDEAYEVREANRLKQQ